MQTLAKIWWAGLPRLFRRAAITPAAALTDGLYITLAPPAAAFLPPSVFGLGLLFGWLHPGFQNVFSESLPFLIVAVLIGILSANLGAMFLIGFAIGDYFLFYPGWMFEKHLFSVILYRFAFVIEYALLATLLVQIPLLTKSLLGQCYKILQLGQAVGVVFAVLGHILLSMTLVFLWAQIVPVLIRPVFVWAGHQPSEEVMQHLQQGNVWLLVAAAALASFVRMALQAVLAFSPEKTERLAKMEEANDLEEIRPLTLRTPRIIRAFFAALWSALLLSGLYSDLGDGILIAAIIFALQLVRLSVLPLPALATWSRWMDKIPLLARLVFGGAVVLGVSALILPAFWRESFRPMLFLIIFGLVLFYLLNPGINTDREDGEAQIA
jgi:hypothetical protein